MKKEIQLLPRQEQILALFLDAEMEFVPIEVLVEKLKVSSRTVQRDLKDTKSLFLTYDIKLRRDKNKGFYIEGEQEAKKKIFNDLYFHSKKVSFTQTERLFSLKIDLLTLNEPLKLYNLSSKYNVSETTASHDLDEVESTLNRYGIELIRKPGFGIEIIGDEEDRRTALVREFTFQIAIEEWLNLLEFPSQTKHKSFFYSILYSLFHFDKLVAFDRLLRPIIQKNAFPYRDQDYVYLLVHIMVIMKRIEDGFELSTYPKGYEQDKNINLALYYKIEGMLSFVYRRKINEYEKVFVAMQLFNPNPVTAITQKEKHHHVSKEIIMRFVHKVGVLLNTTVLLHDEILIEGLQAHLNTSLQRMNKGIPIVNPLHDKVKSQNYDYYTACNEAKDIIEQDIKNTLPENEISYISLHIAASLMRNKALHKSAVKAIVVCSSGIGTGRFLASRIAQELEGIEVVDTISMIKLEEWLEENPAIDLIISTVSLSFVNSHHMVKVSPLLEKKDITLLKSKIVDIQLDMTRQPLNQTKESITLQNTLSIAQYGDALLQIKRNLRVIHLTSFSFEKLFSDLYSTHVISNIDQLIMDLKAREKKGSFVYQNLAMIHTRSESVNELLVIVYRLDNEVQWHSLTTNQEKVKHVLLLASPIDSNDEQINMISQISSHLIDVDLINAIKNGTEEDLKATIMKILITFYKERISMLREE